MSSDIRLQSLYAIPYWHRAAVLVLLLTIVAIAERLIHGQRATRAREYAAWLGLSALGALFGVVNDLVTSSISPAYFAIGKGLSSSPESLPLFAVVDLGARAGSSAGLLLGGLLLLANSPGHGSPPLPTSKFTRYCMAPFACAWFLAPVVAAVVAWDPQGLGDELRAHLSTDDVDRFLLVQRAHVGAYVGAIVGTAWAFPAIRRARRGGAASKVCEERLVQTLIAEAASAKHQLHNEHGESVSADEKRVPARGERRPTATSPRPALQELHPPRLRAARRARDP